MQLIRQRSNENLKLIAFLYTAKRWTMWQRKCIYVQCTSNTNVMYVDLSPTKTIFAWFDCALGVLVDCVSDLDMKNQLK